MKFVLLKRKLGNTEQVRFEWWHLDPDGKKLWNEGWSFNYLSSTDIIVETINLKNWKELWKDKSNIEKTSEYQELIADSNNKELKIGWLAPDGKMHYCKYSNHITYVHLILESDVKQLENLGWIHIYKSYYDHEIFFQTGKLTDAQKYTIVNELGFKLGETDLM